MPPAIAPVATWMSGRPSTLRFDRYSTGSSLRRPTLGVACPPGLSVGRGTDAGLPLLSPSPEASTTFHRSESPNDLGEDTPASDIVHRVCPPHARMARLGARRGTGPGRP